MTLQKKLRKLELKLLLVGCIGKPDEEGKGLMKGEGTASGQGRPARGNTIEFDRNRE